MEPIHLKFWKGMLGVRKQTPLLQCMQILEESPSLPFLSFVPVAWISRLLIHIQVPQQGLGFVSMWYVGMCLLLGLIWSHAWVYD